MSSNLISDNTKDHNNTKWSNEHIFTKQSATLKKETETLETETAETNNKPCNCKRGKNRMKQQYISMIEGRKIFILYLYKGGSGKVRWHVS